MSFVDRLIVFSVGCVIMVIGLIYAGILPVFHPITAGFILFALLVVLVFWNRIRRQIHEALN